MKPIVIVNFKTYEQAMEDAANAAENNCSIRVVLSPVIRPVPVGCSLAGDPNQKSPALGGAFNRPVGRQSRGLVD